MSDLLASIMLNVPTSTMQQRAILTSIAWLANNKGKTRATSETIAQAAGMSIRTLTSHKKQLIDTGLITWIVNNRYNGIITKINKKIGSENMNGSNFPTPDEFSGFDQYRPTPAWAWRVPVETSGQRLMLAAIGLLSDARGVAYCSLASLSEITLLPESTLKRHLTQLIADGWIQREQRRRGNHNAENRVAFTRQFITSALANPPATTNVNEPAATLTKENLPDDMELAGSNLATLIRQAEKTEWAKTSQEPLAKAITDWVETSCGRLAAVRPYNTTEAKADLITLAWIAVKTNPHTIKTSRKPWAMLHRIVTCEAAKIDKKLCGNTRGANPLIETIYENTSLQNNTTTIQDCRPLDVIGVDDLVAMPTINRLVDDLAKQGHNPTKAWAILARVAEIAATNSQQLRHTVARRDFHLALLGVTKNQASKYWMNLLVGSRRANPDSMPISKLLDGAPINEILRHELTDVA